jgi:hypothetical protein
METQIKKQKVPILLCYSKIDNDKQYEMHLTYDDAHSNMEISGYVERINIYSRMKILEFILKCGKKIRFSTNTQFVRYDYDNCIEQELLYIYQYPISATKKLIEGRI